MSYPVKHVSITINRPAQKVYEFTSDPSHLPEWATGLANSTLKQEEETWVTDSPMGKVKIKFAPRNSFGVLDHDVTLPSGEVNHNPFRVITNGNNSEVIFSLFHLPRMSEEEFKRDSEMVLRDLKKLKEILESSKS